MFLKMTQVNPSVYYVRTERLSVKDPIVLNSVTTIQYVITRLNSCVLIFKKTCNIVYSPFGALFIKTGPVSSSDLRFFGKAESQRSCCCS